MRCFCFFVIYIIIIIIINVIIIVLFINIITKGGPRRGHPVYCLELELDAPEALAGDDGLGQLHLGLADLVLVVGLVGLVGHSVQRVLELHDALRQLAFGDVEGLTGHGEGRFLGLSEFDCVALHSVFVTGVSFTAVRGTPSNCNQFSTLIWFG